MQRAEKLVVAEGFNSLPIDPKIIAESREITVEGKPDTNQGVSGMLLRRGNKFGILYATHLNNEGFENFSIGHELGHYFLDGHIDQIFANGDIHTSNAGFTSLDRYEVEADNFSVGLLMPEHLFVKELNKFRDGLNAIEELSTLCKTSLTSTAIRYVECTKCPVAIILSTGSNINFSFLSDEFKEIEGIQFLRKNTSLPKSSRTLLFNNQPQNILRPPLKMLI